MRAILFLVFVVFSNYSSAQLYIKPQINFQFPLTNTIRQDHLPYAQLKNNFGQAFIMPGVRIEYVKRNGNGYFFNLTVLPLGFSSKFTDYAFIDPYYAQQATQQSYTAEIKTSGSSDIIAADVGFLNRLATININKKFSMDLKAGYGLTIGFVRPYSLGYITSIGTNSMSKQFEITNADFPYFDPNKGKVVTMIPLKLDMNFKNKRDNLEILALEFAYWHGFKKLAAFNVAYHNITDNVIYDNVVESKGSTWQMSVLIPIRVNRIGKLKF